MTDEIPRLPLGDNNSYSSNWIFITCYNIIYINNK